MSDNNDEVEVENPVSSWPVLPKEVTNELGSVKLFNKWSYEDVEVRQATLNPCRYRSLGLTITETSHSPTTFRSVHQVNSSLTDLNIAQTNGESQSTSPTPPVDMPQSDSERRNAPSLND